MTNFPTMEFKIMHRGCEVTALKWLPKTTQYRIAGRDDRLTKEAIGQALDQVSEKAFDTAKRANMQLRDRQINFDEWQSALNKARFFQEGMHCLVCNGALDSDFLPVAQLWAAHPYNRIKSHVVRLADADYIQFLRSERERGSLHPGRCPFADFNEAVRTLFTDAIGDFSPLHDPTIQKEMFEDAWNMFQIQCTNELAEYEDLLAEKTGAYYTDGNN